MIEYPEASEQSALGAALANRPACEVFCSAAQPGDFYLPRRALIAETILHLHDEDGGVDPVTVAAELQRRGELEKAGGPEYLHTLAEFVPSATNVASYIADVQEAAHRRHLYRVSLQLGRLATDPNWNGDRVDAWLQVATEGASVVGWAGRREPRVYTEDEFRALSPEAPDWLVFGYVVRGEITELDAKIKAGKTTFMLDMVRSLCDGREFLGHATEQCNVLYLPEEGCSTFKAALRRTSEKTQGRLRILPRSDEAIAGMTWQQRCLWLSSYCRDHQVDVAIIDTLTDWVGHDREGAESDATTATSDMRHLRTVSDAGVAVVVLRHEGKDPMKAVGDSGRGSSAYGGGVDTIVSLRRQRGDANSHKRDLQATGRHDETPAEVVVEFADGHYRLLGEKSAVNAASTADLVCDCLLVGREHAQTGDEIAGRLEGRVGRSTVYNVLSRLASAGRVTAGEGVSGKRRGYWLPDNDEVQP
jgi:hypothetical protein